MYSYFFFDPFFARIHMSKKAILLFFFVVLSLASCAGRTTVTPQKNEKPESHMSALDARIAEFLGTAPEGAAATFHGTQFGSVTVVAGAGYMSALGIPCREGRAQGGARSTLAACHDPGRGWILAPDIQGDGAF